MLSIRKYLLLLCIPFCIACSEDNGEIGNLTGRGGSMARFTVTSSHLYTVDNESLNVYQILENGKLVKINDVSLGFGVETIFAKDDKLFIGTTTAMYIFDIKNGSAPAFLSEYSHVVSCDPVVVQDTIAYVTLRTGTSCRNNVFTSSLDVVNVKDLRNPLLIGSYTMDTPYGLGVDGNMLFVCEGSNGLKVFDVSNPMNLSILSTHTAQHAYDVIANEGHLILTGNNGIYQYDYSNRNLILLSHIPAENNE